MATSVADIEAVDFEPDEDDLMDEDPAADLSSKLRSTITAAGDAKKTKGRGFRESETESQRHRRLADANFESLTSDGGPGPQRSIEGWIVLVTGVHEEAQEDHLHEAFREYGQIKNLHLNLDRRTGFVKGYALVEYENFDEAQTAIRSLDGSELLTQTIYVDWAFSNGSFKRRNTKRSPRAHRSRSPPRRRY